MTTTLAPMPGSATDHTTVPTAEAGTDLDALVETYLAADSDEQRHRALDAVVRAALPLADSLAARYGGRGIDAEDLTQVARTALVAALGRYRPGVGHGFAAFAAPTIRGELKRYFRDSGWMVRPPRALQELRAEVTRAEEDLRHELGRDVTLAELAASVKRDLADVTAARSCASAFAPGSLDAPVAGGGTSGEFLADPSDHAAAIDLRAAVRAEVARLTPRERLILRLRFVDERTQREIGEVVGVSQMQVSRVLTSVLCRLRDRLGVAPAA